jgi:hypothetical protein
MAMNFQEFRSWFDERFSFLLQQKIEVFAAHSDSAAVREISAYVELLAANGKRFRPFLVYLSNGFDREIAEDHKDLFFAVELLHLFALIHDDIMDEADTRHGVTCAHKQFDAQYGTAVGEAIDILLGIKLLVCTGDTMTSISFIHDVVVNQCKEMKQFNCEKKILVIFSYLSIKAIGKIHEKRAKSLAISCKEFHIRADLTNRRTITVCREYFNLLLE